MRLPLMLEQLLLLRRHGVFRFLERRLRRRPPAQLVAREVVADGVRQHEVAVGEALHQR